MNERVSRFLRDLMLPVGVVLIGCALSVGGWRLLLSERKAQLAAAAAEASEGARAALESQLASQAAALDGLADQWARFGRKSAAEWLAGVNLLIETNDGLASVAWIGLRGAERRVAVGASRDPAGLEVDAAEARRHGRSPHVRGPELDDEGVWYRAFVPVDTAGEDAGVLVADVRLAELIAPVLRARSPGYAVSIVWDGQEVFVRGQASTDEEHAWWKSETVVPVPYGGEWRVVHRPTAELAAARLTDAPDYLLGAGVVLSLLLGVVVHEWRVVTRQARFLATANEALEEKGRDLERLNVELERRVAERTEQLEDVVAELEAFNSSVSHDLRSPIGAVLNLAAILEEDYRERRLDDEGRDLIARIRRSASRATALLEGLLDLSRARQTTLRLERIDMGELAREMFAQASLAGEDAEDDGDVELVVEPLPPARGDRVLLGTVFANLLSNALKYSRGCEKRRIAVTGRVVGDECVYEIADNGRGFDMRFAPKLFGLFERLHGDEEIEGTGIGLAMVARIVQRHGGRVWAEGEVDAGARFSFSLPAAGALPTAGDGERGS